MRKEPIVFEGPTVWPVLPSGSNVLDTCGPLNYVTVVPTNNAYTVVEESDPTNLQGALIRVESANEAIPPKIAPYKAYDTITTTASFNLYPIVTYTKDTTFAIYDNCFGMTYDTAVIDLGNSKDTVTDLYNLK